MKEHCTKFYPIKGSLATMLLNRKLLSMGNKCQKRQQRDDRRHSERFKDLNIRHGTIKLLEESMGKIFSDK